MRRLIAHLLAFAFVFSNVSVATAVTPKAGATCKKLGAVVVSGGKEFKCIKRGTKRVWSKGVTIKVTPTATPSVSVTPTPTASPTPSVSASPTPSPSPTRTASPSPTPTPSPTSTVKEYTRAEVSQRNSAASCWTIVNESVYDLTSWINSHPGGPSAIRSLCGTDGTASFTGTHGNSSSPMRELNSRYLGKLKS